MATEVDERDEKYQGYNDRFKQFCDEVEEAGLEWRHYQGRFFYAGPAVVVDNLQDGIRATTVPVQWDDFGKGHIVYPK